PFVLGLPLHEFGLEYIQPEVFAAHPFADGTAAALYPSLGETAEMVGADSTAYGQLGEPLVRYWPRIAAHILTTMLRVPESPLALAAFGLKSLQSGKQIASRFRTREAKGLWAGMVAHSMIPLESLTSSAIGFVLTIAGHRGGWPVPKGGSQSIANAMGA